MDGRSYAWMVGPMCGWEVLCVDGRSYMWLALFLHVVNISCLSHDVTLCEQPSHAVDMFL